MSVKQQSFSFKEIESGSHDECISSDTGCVLSDYLVDNFENIVTMYQRHGLKLTEEMSAELGLLSDLAHHFVCLGSVKSVMSQTSISTLLDAYRSLSPLDVSKAWLAVKSLDSEEHLEMVKAATSNLTILGKDPDVVTHLSVLRKMAKIADGNVLELTVLLGIHLGMAISYTNKKYTQPESVTHDSTRRRFH